MTKRTAKAQDLVDQLSCEEFRKAVEDIIRRFQEELIHERKELLEQQKVFDVRFAQKVYAAGTSQVSLLMLAMETKSENLVCGKPVQVVDESPKVQVHILNSLM
ncbi:uncharacterized protein [Nicotiana sylvestris]|uniref:Uncharacterized protein LOC104219774 n=1 Tax=Nicotiana sylvestris TaxID=4096 RepID=A0A1U7VV13_NICSY|nr:PREDICTED: uncharacterized protein LOC104219774 [Nicotiana sylvestris]